MYPEVQAWQQNLEVAGLSPYHPADAGCAQPLSLVKVMVSAPDHRSVMLLALYHELYIIFSVDPFVGIYLLV